MIAPKHLIDGGIPSAWTIENLRWLAQAHRSLAANKRQRPYFSVEDDGVRERWHLRWAALLEDLLETNRRANH